MMGIEDLRAKLRADNLRTWLEHEAIAHADPNQRERYTAGVLPEPELTAIARGILFDPFSIFKRWRNMESHHVRHARAHEVSLETVTFDVMPLATLSAYDWDALGIFQAVVNNANLHEWLIRSRSAFSLETRVHTGRCGICKAYRKEHSVLVSVEWAGRPLSREYRLEVPV